MEPWGEMWLLLQLVTVLSPPVSPFLSARNRVIVVSGETYLAFGGKTSGTRTAIPARSSLRRISRRVCATLLRVLGRVHPGIGLSWSLHGDLGDLLDGASPVEQKTWRPMLGLL